MAAAVSSAPQCGATVLIEAVPDFDKLRLEEATSIVYEKVVPACEENKVLLSFYGNHNSVGSISDIEEYNEMKADKKLFKSEAIQRIQKMFPFIAQHCQERSSYNEDNNSYGLKHILEKHIGYCTNGELIVAMLLHGYSARFGTDKMEVNAHFKVEITDSEDAS